MEDFGARLIAAHQQGLAEARAQKQFEQEQQIHKLNVDKANLDFKTAKFNQQLHELALNPNPVAPEAQVAAAQPMMAPPPDLAGSTVAAPPPQAMPAATQSIPLPLPPRYVEGMNGPVAVPTISSQQLQQATLLQHLQDIKLAGLKKGAEETATEAAKAPYAFHELTPGASGVIGPGTPGQKIVEGPPAKGPEPSSAIENMTVDGKGPVPIHVIKQGDKTLFTTLDGMPIAGARLGAYERPREAKDTSLQESNALEKSYQFHTTQLGNLTKPLEDRATKFQTLQDAINAGTPLADALVAPTLLSLVSGGSGSGLRINEAEISRIVGGRSNWESIKAALNKWNTDPNKANSILENQRGQIRNLVDAIGSKLEAKKLVLSSTQQQLASSKDTEQNKQIYAKSIGVLDALDAGRTVKMVAPDGTEKDVAATDVYHYLTLGAKLK